jgi:hypothetical protein
VFLDGRARRSAISAFGDAGARNAHRLRFIAGVRRGAGATVGARRGGRAGSSGQGQAHQGGGRPGAAEVVALTELGAEGAQLVGFG